MFPFCKTKLPKTIQSRDPSYLIPEFREKLEEALTICKKAGFQMEIGCSVRGPIPQGVLWSGSHTPRMIEAWKIDLGETAPKLVECVEDLGYILPFGSKFFPGQSWHQWGQAADVFLQFINKAVWGGSPAEKLEEACKKVGLWTGKMVGHGRPWHVQLRKEENPLMVRGLCEGWAELEQTMCDYYEM